MTSTTTITVPRCAHEAVAHRDHIDYAHDGHRHASHDDHRDQH